MNTFQRTILFRQLPMYMVQDPDHTYGRTMVFTCDVINALQLGIEKPALWRELALINPRLIIGIKPDGRFYTIVHPDSISDIRALIDREMDRAIQDLLQNAFAK